MLVCVQDGEICCLNKQEFDTLIKNRIKNIGYEENQYQILVTARQNERLRSYVNAANVRGSISGDPIIIARNAFPSKIFS